MPRSSSFRVCMVCLHMSSSQCSTSAAPVSGFRYTHKQPIARQSRMLKLKIAAFQNNSSPPRTFTRAHSMSALRTVRHAGDPQYAGREGSSPTVYGATSSQNGNTSAQQTFSYNSCCRWIALQHQHARNRWPTVGCPQPSSLESIACTGIPFSLEHQTTVQLTLYSHIRIQLPESWNHSSINRIVQCTTRRCSGRQSSLAFCRHRPPKWSFVHTRRNALQRYRFSLLYSAADNSSKDCNTDGKCFNQWLCLRWHVTQIIPNQYNFLL